MTLRTILVCLANPSSAPSLMMAGVALAQKHNAHLIGLHTVEALTVYPSVAMHMEGAIYEQYTTGQAERSDAIKGIFEKYTKAESFPTEWRLLQNTTMTSAARIIESARAVDLVLVGQGESENDRPDQSTIRDQVIRYSGRPVLVVPHGYEGASIGDNVLLGWSATREAARAAHDMLALTVPGSKATVLKIGNLVGDEFTDHAANALASHLDRHGLISTVVHRDKAGRDIAGVMLHEALEIGADLIATGAFGHSWTYDFVIGAVTRDLLRTAKVPVLYSK